VSDIDFPADLLALERTAWEEIQAGRLTLDTATAVQARLTVFAAEAGVDRYTAEMGLKKTVRHPERAEA
jgi:transcriptional regulator